MSPIARWRVSACWDQSKLSAHYGHLASFPPFCQASVLHSRDCRLRFLGAGPRQKNEPPCSVCCSEKKLRFQMVTKYQFFQDFSVATTATSLSVRGTAFPPHLCLGKSEIASTGRGAVEGCQRGQQRPSWSDHSSLGEALHPLSLMHMLMKGNSRALLELLLEAHIVGRTSHPPEVDAERRTAPLLLDAEHGPASAKYPAHPLSRSAIKRHHLLM